jgi:hypothetical protein
MSNYNTNVEGVKHAVRTLSTTRDVLSSLEALFTVTTKLADRVGNDEIRISNARAKELLRDITVARAKLKSLQAFPERNAAINKRLDAIFGL